MIWDLLIGLFCLINAFIDNRRIKANKKIYHGINGLIFLSFVILIWLVSKQSPVSILRMIILRQIFFDIPLNLLRHLSWSCDSIEAKPKAITDRVERFLFRGISWLDEATYLIIYITLSIWAG